MHAFVTGSIHDCTVHVVMLQRTNEKFRDQHPVPHMLKGVLGNVWFTNCMPQIAVVPNHFLEITPANRNQLGRNFTGRRWLRWHALVWTFGQGHKIMAKNSFCEQFVTKTKHRFTHFPAVDFRDIQTRNVNRCRVIMSSFGIELPLVYNESEHGPL